MSHLIDNLLRPGLFGPYTAFIGIVMLLFGAFWYYSNDVIETTRIHIVLKKGAGKNGAKDSSLPAPVSSLVSAPAPSDLAAAAKDASAGPKEDLSAPPFTSATSPAQAAAPASARLLKLAHLSDLHGKTFGRGNGRLYRAVCALQPDLICYTGDLEDGPGRRFAAAARLLQRLAQQVCPVFYIPGNHEHRYGHMEEMAAILAQSGVTVLQNRSVTLQIGDNKTTINGNRPHLNGQKVHILGLDEKQSYGGDEPGCIDEMNALLQEYEKRGGIKIVLSHYPEHYALMGERSYRRHDFDLMLSGHAHGGQFRLPYIGAVYAPGQGLFPRYTCGLYGERPPYLHVNRGLGASAFPLRLFNRPEVSLITIEIL
ncbi:MAG: metallophosphoesterase [Christensenellales bacterium]|jgi:predicted MPP superfamily phosphohydrolase